MQTQTQTSDNKSRKQVKKEAFILIKNLVDQNQDKKYQNALKMIRPSLYGMARQGGGGGLLTKFIQFVVEKKAVSENAIFAEFKIARKECAGLIRKALRGAEPANRLWIKFDAKTGTYTVVGKGKDAPKDWDGYVPVEQNINLK